MKIVYFGTPQFAANVLQFLTDNQVDVVAVITKPDKAKGRSGSKTPTPVKLIAEKNNLPYHQPEFVSDFNFLDDT